ncbi:collectin-11-like [Biomphalaria glabrata]|uniref:Collectin-11-like n=1 Tax=Biomphalaria glabrata TaxID=6526 RepID=A0A9W2YBN3_BIOGL|nr:collectin-11-like [Biomphalaria glabrata]
MHLLTVTNNSRSKVNCATRCFTSSFQCEAFIFQETMQCCMTGLGLWKMGVFPTPLQLLYSSGVNYCPSESGYTQVFSNDTGLCLYVSNETDNYSTASHSCKQKSGILMTVKTFERNTIVMSIVNQVGRVYIGLDDIVTEGHFVWSDGTNLTDTQMAFIFRIGKPSPINSAEDCCVIRSDGGNDEACSTLYKYICEYVP